MIPASPPLPIGLERAEADALAAGVAPWTNDPMPAHFGSAEQPVEVFANEAEHVLSAVFGGEIAVLGGRGLGEKCARGPGGSNGGFWGGIGGDERGEKGYLIMMTDFFLSLIHHFFFFFFFFVFLRNSQD
jgi:hypothetical protein